MCVCASVCIHTYKSIQMQHTHMRHTHICGRHMATPSANSFNSFQLLQLRKSLFAEDIISYIGNYGFLLWEIVDFSYIMATNLILMFGIELFTGGELLLLALGPTHYEVTVGGGGRGGAGGGRSATHCL